jgi:hypothetical protein
MAVDGVQRVEANPLTGGLLIMHDGSLEPILAHASARSLFYVDPTEPAGPPPAERLRRQLGELSRDLRQASDGAADLASLVFLVLLVAAIVQLLRGRMLAPAVTLLWYAAGTVLVGLPTADGERADRTPGTPTNADRAERSSAP